jgi:hypothetical protein
MLPTCDRLIRKLVAPRAPLRDGACCMPAQRDHDRSWGPWARSRLARAPG